VISTNQVSILSIPSILSQLQNMSQSRSNGLLSAAEQKAHEASTLLQGQVPNTDGDVAIGHPIHPGTVHWPIAFLSASFGITTLQLLPLSLYPASLLPPVATLTALAHYSAGAGALTAIPAIVTGFGEAYELIRVQVRQKGSLSKVLEDAWYLKDEGGKKVKTTITHASMNDLVVGLATYNWYRGWKYPTTALPKFSFYANAAALPLLLYSAYLGGKLVYEYGVGVKRQGSSKPKNE